MPSKELFKQTTSIVNSDLKEKIGINFFIYDMFPISNFDSMQKFSVSADIRKDKMAVLMSIYE